MYIAKLPKTNTCMKEVMGDLIHDTSSFIQTEPNLPIGCFVLDSCFVEACFVPVLQLELEPSSPQADTVGSCSSE